MLLGSIISLPWMRLQAGAWPAWSVVWASAAVLFITGALLHVLFQLTGVNAWYVQQYPG